MKWRSIFRTLHLVTGLTAGLVAAAVGISGSILTFRAELEHALYTPRVTPQTTPVALGAAYAKAAAVEPEQRRIAVIVLPEQPAAPLEFILGKRGARNLKDADQLSLYANPYTGEIIGQRRRNDSFIAWLRDLHFALFGGVTGLQVNGWLALVLIFIALTGLALWLQTYVRGKAFAVNWSASWRRLTWDLHRLTGSVMLVLLLIAAATGAYYAFRETALKVLASTVGALPPRGTPAVTAALGATPLGVEAMLEKARPLVSGAQLAVLRPPATPAQAWTATYHRAGDSGESVDSGPTAYFDPYTGALLRLDDPRAMGGAARALKTIEPLHFGKFAGLPGKLLWFVLGLAPAFLFGSGCLMWWNRKFKKLK